MALAVTADNSLYSLLQRFVVVLGRQRQDASPMAEQVISNFAIYLQTLWYSHPQPRQHDRDQTTGAGAIHIIEIMTGEKFIFVEGATGGVWYRAELVLQSSLAFSDLMHESLEDE
jgi:hypothetical protein